MSDINKILKTSKASVNKDSKLQEAVSKYFNIKSSSSIIKDPNIKMDWLVEDLFLAGGTSVLIAREKTGKSTLARQIGLAIAEGQEIFGKKVRKGLVFYVALEELTAGIKEHFKSMQTNGAENFLFHCGAVKSDLVEALENFCEFYRPDMIILDTLAKALRVSDLNDYTSTIKALQPITDLARKYNSHILYLHHMNKNSNGSDLSKAMGSVAITGEVDSIIFLEKDVSGIRTLKSFPRYGKPIEELPLTWLEEKMMYEIKEFF